MTIDDYALSDRYTQEQTTSFLSGVQALARLPLEQLMADKNNGLNTAAFVSGYPGSPLGGYGDEVDRATSINADLPLRHIPAINEEHAATAVMGSQLVTTRADALHQGVVGVWYGKAPGLERASDAIRHAVLAGTGAYGGVVALVGDDPGAKSSTVPSNSTDILAALRIPVLVPGDPAALLELGRHAISMSRAAGLWASVRVVADVADGTSSVQLDASQHHPVSPERPANLLAPTGRVISPFNLELERELIEVRLPIALDYIRLNKLNRVTAGNDRAEVGIIASGNTHRQVHEALKRLGMQSNDDIASNGIRILEMAVTYPVDTSTIKKFAHGLSELIIIEEKQPIVETAVRDILSGAANSPRIIGKSVHHADPIAPHHGTLDTGTITTALRTRLSERLGDRLAPVAPQQIHHIELTVERSPFFCSGCPHNSSTVVPEGSVVGAGIGCHTMVMLGEPGRGGDIVGVTAMGNEGSLWIGMEDFVSTDHMIQNIGDGTYFHSGQLAITSAVAAGSHMTFKLLYNGAVSMTGGQTPSGQLSPAAVAANLLRQGVTRVIVTTDDTDRHNDWPTEVDVWHRSRLIEAQEVLAATPGVTVLIHDQPCAAELRRDRKRGRAVTPTDRIVIDHRICEGCGDCGRTSNCLSVQAFDTPWGRKTRIDQNSCNLDQSCVDGDCPSFIAVDTEPSLFARLTSRMFDRNGTPTRQTSTEIPPTEPPTPTASTDRDDLAIRLTGVGGTGVVTVAQVIGTAAMLDGWSVQGIDQIGLSQKAGPVVSDIRLSRGGAVQASRLGQGDADVLIALDNLVAAGANGLGVISPTTMVVGSSTETPTASMIAHPELHLPNSDDIESTLGDATDSTKQLWADAAQITTRFLGDATTANVFVVGMAVQIGALPISLDSLSEAIRVNGAAVEANLTALRLGRLYAVGQLNIDAPSSTTAEVELHDDVIGRCAEDVKAHSGTRASQRFLDTVQRVRDVDPDPSLELTTSVASHLHQLMTYKDEYEVARLITTGDGAGASDSIADGKGVRYRLLHPPILAAMGVKRKLRFGPGWIPMFKLLRRARVLRGTPLDIFGYARVRKIERSLPGEYLELVDAITTSVSTLPYTRLVEFARLPDVIRGYEELKESRVEIFRTQRTAALAELK